MLRKLAAVLANPLVNAGLNLAAMFLPAHTLAAKAALLATSKAVQAAAQAIADSPEDEAARKSLEYLGEQAKAVSVIANAPASADAADARDGLRAWANQQPTPPHVEDGLLGR